MLIIIGCILNMISLIMAFKLANKRDSLPPADIEIRKRKIRKVLMFGLVILTIGIMFQIISTFLG